MATTVLSASRAGLGSVVVISPTAIVVSAISNVGIVDSGFTKVPAAAEMDGVASVSVVAHVTIPAVANMDGVASIFSTGAAHLAPGAVEMDGVASVYIPGLGLGGGYARMDGQAQVSSASSNFAPGAAQMDGSASDVVMQSVPGAGLAEMDGWADVIFTAPNRYNLNLFDTVIGSDAASLLMTYKRIITQNLTGSDSTKVLMRYHIVEQQNINLHLTSVNRMNFRMLLREIAITLTGILAPHSQWHYTLTSGFNVRPTIPLTWNAVLSLVQNLTVHPATSLKFTWGRVLTQAFKVSPAVTAGVVYKRALTQLVRLSDVDAFSHTLSLVLSQAVNVSLSVASVTSLKLLQNILAAASASPIFNYHFTLAAKVVIGQVFDKFASAVLTQLFTVHPTINRQYIANNSLAQLLSISSSLTNTLTLEVTESINLDVDAEQLVRMIYAGDPLLDGVVITALYISPSGTTTTWAVNTRTNAVTEYTNYDFRSFAMMGNRYIAAGADGLYELDGDTDDGAAIISEMMSGYLQLNEKKLFGIKGAYVAIRGGGRFYLKLVSGDGREYVYELRAQPNLMTTKVKVGKGIRTTYMAFDLITEGQDFDLDSIEFIPMTSGRRV